MDEASPASFCAWECTESGLHKESLQEVAGVAAGTATWLTNVGNERREILISVVTDSEGLLALKPMAEGLMKK